MSRACLAIAGLALLCALLIHLRRNTRLRTGVVLVATMFSFQAVFHPSAEQAISQQLEADAEDEEAADGDPASPLKAQMRRHAKRIQSGQPYADLILHLSSPVDPGKSHQQNTAPAQLSDAAVTPETGS